MLTFIAFALTIAGCINWLMIGLLQYDFVAGIFGYQGSVFSRIIYIIVGAAAMFLVVRLFLDKGSIHVWGAKKKREKSMTKELENAFKPAHANVEASKEERRRRDSGYSEDSHDFDRDSRSTQNRQMSLFDEHLDDRNL